MPTTHVFVKIPNSHNQKSIHLKPYHLLRSLPLYLLSCLVFLSFLGGAGLSLYLNSEFGASRVGELGRWIAIICDLFKIGLSAALLFIPGWTARVFGLLGVLLFALLSIFSSYGYYIQYIEHTKGTTLAEKTKYRVLLAQKNDLQRSLIKLGTHRPLAAIEADIKAHKRDIIYTNSRRSNQCRNATIEESRNFCNRLRQLQVEYAAAKDVRPKRQHINNKLSALDVSLKTINLTTISKRADPFAASFGNPDRFNVYFNLFLALLIEIATTAGLPVVIILLRGAYSTHMSPLDQAQQRIERLQEDVQKHKAAADNALTYASDLHGIKRFMKDELQITELGFVFSGDLTDRYQRWCKHNVVPQPLSSCKLSETIHRMGFARERRRDPQTRKRRTGYAGICFKSS